MSVIDAIYRAAGLSTPPAQLSAADGNARTATTPASSARASLAS